MRIAPSLTRQCLYIALALASLALLLVPGLDGAALRATVLVLFFVEGADSTLTGWKAGHLSVPLRELAKRPPRSDPLQVLAFVLGLAALFKIFSG